AVAQAGSPREAGTALVAVANVRAFSPPDERARYSARPPNSQTSMIRPPQFGQGLAGPRQLGSLRPGAGTRIARPSPSVAPFVRLGPLPCRRRTRSAD